ncbi:hypothetical protein BH10CYA1_BH10CYA1_40620 [soil metagenome]
MLTSSNGYVRPPHPQAALADPKQAERERNKAPSAARIAAEGM